MNIHKESRVYLSLNNVKKSYGRKLALDNVSMSLKEGQILAIVGPVGAGKTTILKVIAGLEEVTAGKVVFQGEVISNLEPWKREFAMVFETYALYPHRSVYENIASSLVAMNMGKQDIQKKVNDIADLLQISPYLKRKPSDLSGGQRQRVAVGRALVKPANLYLMDEPIAHLDAKLRHQMVGEFVHLQKSQGLSMVYVTNNWQEALSLGDSVAVLRDGVVIQFGTKEEIFQKPDNTFVASIIGDPAMNLISGKVVKKADRTFFEIEKNKGVEVRTHSPIVSQKAILGVRPNKIHLGPYDEEAVGAEVYSVERLGLRFVVSLKLAERIYKAVSETLPPFIQVGQQVGISLDLKGACLFTEQGDLAAKLEGADGQQ